MAGLIQYQRNNIPSLDHVEQIALSALPGGITIT